MGRFAAASVGTASGARYWATGLLGWNLGNTLSVPVFLGMAIVTFGRRFPWVGAERPVAAT